MANLSRRTSWIVMAVILVGAAALRFINLGIEPLWGDEAIGASASEEASSFADLLLYLRALGDHPPLFYALQRAVGSVFGYGEFALRIPWMLVSLLSIFVAYISGARMVSRRVGLWAAATLAILPLHVEFSQEARPYIGMLLAAQVQLYALWRMFNEPRRTTAFYCSLLLYVVAGLAGWYLHYSYTIILFSLALYWTLALVVSRQLFWTWLGAHAAIFVGYLWWLPVLLGKLAIGAATIYGLERTILDSGREVGSYATTFVHLIWTYEYTIEPLVMLWVMVATVATVAASFLVLRNVSWSDVGYRNAGALVGWFFVVAPVVYLLAPASADYTPLGIRHALPFLASVSLLGGMLFDQLSPTFRWGLAAILCVSLLPALTIQLSDKSRYDVNYAARFAAAALDQEVRPGDLIITPRPLSRVHLGHYLHSDTPVVSLFPVAYYGEDEFKTNRRLGMIENELTFRYQGAQTTARREIRDKLIRLVEHHDATRVWFFSFPDNEHPVHWLDEDEWTITSAMVDRVRYPLDLIERKELAQP